MTRSQEDQRQLLSSEVKERKPSFSKLVKCVQLNIQYSVCALKRVFPLTDALQGATVPELRAEVERFVLCYFNKV